MTELSHLPDEDQRVDIWNPLARSYWSMKIGITSDQLVDAVLAVGGNPLRIESYARRAGWIKEKL